MNNVNNTQITIFSGNSLGLENDSLVIKNAFKKLYPDLNLNVLLGKENHYKKIKEILKLVVKKLIRKKLIFIHMEDIQSKLTWIAEKNYLIPNQEWFRSHTEKKVTNDNKIYLLCKTLEAMTVFSDFHNRRHYIGFASLDRYQENIKKDYCKFLHLAGKSEKKGTLSIIHCWKNHPEWPVLTLKTSVDDHIEKAKNIANIAIISDNLNFEDLSHLMNSHGVHICTSEMEGFGHSIVEALSTGAVVMTTDAAPMNENVTSEHGFLIRCEEKYQQYRGRGFLFDERVFEQEVNNIIDLPNGELEHLSHKARTRYLKIKSNFETNLKNYFDETFNFQ